MLGLPMLRKGPRYPLYSSLAMPMAIGTLRGAAPIANPSPHLSFNLKLEIRNSKLPPSLRPIYLTLKNT